ncbi:hypothetical protein FGG08_004056 [Glutinoglossum americanum]|uniref:Fe2OG dioxygenase domain-containing protein n=1 Tax=Glutinoglossum americanum TaxID=1670608 RepID=A0A9P8KXG2_9PEZI|nr:hypothetical protein FGG08_004056 [Glutinoglossum americanum]
MDAFVSRKRRRLSTPADAASSTRIAPNAQEDSTELKLAILSSLHPNIDQGVLLEVLLSSEGSVDEASRALLNQAFAPDGESPRKKSNIHGAITSQQQTSLSSFITPPPTRDGSTSPQKRPPRTLAKKGKTVHLFSPEDIAAHTPCSIIHNFLPAEEANALLEELLEESKTFERQTFKLFDNVVQSPHTACFYVASLEEDIRLLPRLTSHISAKVCTAVNSEIQSRIQTHYPSGRKLKHQSPHEWIPNAAFVNCYDGPAESVGYHSDQLTYLGPHATIGSLSLGVSREFRVRRIIPQDPSSPPTSDANDQTGALSIHLPNNSLLIMHAEMQEEWKHSIHPAATVIPHPIAGNRRINITYRHYKKSLHPRLTPRCACKIPAVLRVVQRKKENWGRYFWMCHAGNVPGKEGCKFFQWAEFDDDGEPIWGKKENS